MLMLGNTIVQLRRKAMGITSGDVPNGGRSLAIMATEKFASMATRTPPGADHAVFRVTNCSGSARLDVTR